MKREVKLGLFVLGGILILIVGIFSIRDFKSLSGGYTLRVIFDFGDGIKPAAPVRVAGVEVGEVRSVSLEEEEGKVKVVVHAWIRRGTKVPKGSEAFVNNLGVLGEKYLEIIPKEGSKEYLEEGEIIRGESSTPLYKLGRLAGENLMRFSNLLSSLEKFIKDEDMTSTFKKFAASLEEASTSIEGFIRDLRERRGTIGRFIYEDTLYKDLEEFVKDLKAHPWKLLHKPKQ